MAQDAALGKPGSGSTLGAITRPVASTVSTLPLTPEQVRLRRRIFYGVFAFLGLMWLSIVPTYWVGTLWPELEIFRDISGFVMFSIVWIAPQILHDVPIVGDLVPALLGAIIAATAPPTATNRQLLTVLLLSFVTYAAYLYMSVFFSLKPTNEFLTIKLEPLLAHWGLVPKDDINVLQSFSSSVRNFAVFVFAALIGFKFNDPTSIAIPFRNVLGPGAAPATSGDLKVEALEPSPNQPATSNDARPSPFDAIPQSDESDGAATPDVHAGGANG
jgi:hypothetical protein